MGTNTLSEDNPRKHHSCAATSPVARQSLLAKNKFPATAIGTNIGCTNPRGKTTTSSPRRQNEGEMVRRLGTARQCQLVPAPTHHPVRGGGPQGAEQVDTTYLRSTIYQSTRMIIHIPHWYGV
ncbi:hypothetical protein BDW42DRAFT_165785 [Aspergillus taichungensis]|uniref:Uncharacterized protein n=1 Tax=Aspergillus taichungensis TaxID=482145 RepID=A0A2J5HZQ3_9EURO|nr:hypothetical protein BDW42DRAFT_165785 [Aspergillus taichungensis]